MEDTLAKGDADVEVSRTCDLQKQAASIHPVNQLDDHKNSAKDALRKNGIFSRSSRCS